MKKPKLSLGPGGIQGLLIQHVEKLVFGLALLLVLVFVVLGYRIQSDLADKTPDKLDKLAATAVSNIERPSMEELKKERIPRDGKGGQYALRVTADNPPDPEVFAIKPWDQPLGSPGSKREDPTIFAPVKLETTALTGPLCIRAEEGDTNPLADLENAPATEKKEKRTKRTRRGPGASAGMYGSGSSPMPGGSGFPGMPGDVPGSGMDMAANYGLGRGAPGEPGEKDKKKKEDPQQRRAERTYPESKVCGYRPGGMLGPSPASMMSSAMAGMMSSAMGRPPGGAAPGSSEDGGVAPGQPLARSAHVVIVKALVPFRKQADEYKRVLGEAIGYDPLRDQPRIIFFQAQRVDVTDDPSKEVQESDWQLVMTPKTAQAKAVEQRWHGVMTEIADAAYVDANATMPCPPMMLRCMDDAMLHSEVPRGKPFSPLEMARSGEEGKGDDTGKTEGAAAPASDLPGGVPGGMVGRPGMSGFPGMAAGGYPGMAGGGSGFPGMPLPGGSGSAGMPMPGGSGMAGMPMPGGSGFPGMPMPGGSGYPGMPGGSAMAGMASAGSAYMGPGRMGPGGYPGSYGPTPQVVQYKLIRFSDLDVQPGRVYRYRVRVFLEDPNNPNTDPTNGFVSVPPRRRSLSLRVIERLNKLQSEESGKGVYYVMSEWSEPTGSVTVPSPSRVFAGEVEPARTAAGAEGTLVQQSEPYGNVVPVAWHETRAVDVALETRAYRGSVLNYTKRAFDVLDPITLVIKQLRNSDLKTNHLVVDVRGGEDLPGDRKSLVTAPGEVALIDDRGTFIVRNELDDYLDYARFSLADEVSSTRMPGGVPGMGMGAGLGDGESAGGYPGMGAGLGDGESAGGYPGMGAPMPGMGPPMGGGAKRGARGSAPPGMGAPGGRRGR